MLCEKVFTWKVIAHRSQLLLVAFSNFYPLGKLYKKRATTFSSTLERSKFVSKRFAYKFFKVFASCSSYFDFFFLPDDKKIKLLIKSIKIIKASNDRVDLLRLSTREKDKFILRTLLIMSPSRPCYTERERKWEEEKLNERYFVWRQF